MEQLVQGSPEWFAARLGKVTASRIADVVARTKSGWGASRANYMSALICERLTGAAEETYINAAMAWGTEKEPEARAAYEFLTGNTVDLVGFVDHPKIAMSGASPDGHIGAEGSLEIKCPNTATHIEFLLEEAIPQKYALQMQWQMACSGRAWTDFVSYDPRMPEGLRMFLKRVDRDSALIPTLEKDVTEFLAELDAIIAKLRARLNDA